MFKLLYYVFLSTKNNSIFYTKRIILLQYLKISHLAEYKSENNLILNNFIYFV